MDAKGKRYEIPGCHRYSRGEPAASTASVLVPIRPRSINSGREAKAHPVPPVEIPSEAAPVHEIVITGDELKKTGKGLDSIPVPISTPGWDNHALHQRGALRFSSRSRERHS